MPAIENLITSTGLHGDAQMRLVQQRNVRYDEPSVTDVMAVLSTLDAIEFESMRTATMGALVATLRRCGRNHLLVMESAAGAPLPRPSTG